MFKCGGRRLEFESRNYIRSWIRQLSTQVDRTQPRGRGTVVRGQVSAVEKDMTLKGLAHISVVWLFYRSTRITSTEFTDPRCCIISNTLVNSESFGLTVLRQLFSDLNRPTADYQLPQIPGNHINTYFEIFFTFYTFSVDSAAVRRGHGFSAQRSSLDTWHSWWWWLSRHWSFNLYDFFFIDSNNKQDQTVILIMLKITIKASKFF